MGTQSAFFWNEESESNRDFGVVAAQFGTWRDRVIDTPRFDVI